MRAEEFGAGVFVHIVQRGAKGTNIVRDDTDRWRFLRLLRYLNDQNVPRNWDRDITPEHIHAGFERPDSWPEQKPYVSILAYCLMDNHFHLLVQGKDERGISEFMQRLCTSMATFYNTKYRERGSLFQGPYRARVVDSDVYLQYLAAYIQVKNPFERYPAGLREAVRFFDDAYEWARRDPFTSLGDYLGTRRAALIDLNAVNEVFESDNFMSFARDVIEGKFADFVLEERELELY